MGKRLTARQELIDLATRTGVERRVARADVTAHIERLAALNGERPGQFCKSIGEYWQDATSSARAMLVREVRKVIADGIAAVDARSSGPQGVSALYGPPDGIIVTSAPTIPEPPIDPDDTPTKPLDPPIPATVNPDAQTDGDFYDCKPTRGVSAWLDDGVAVFVAKQRSRWNGVRFADETDGSL